MFRRRILIDFHRWEYLFLFFAYYEYISGRYFIVRLTWGSDLYVFAFHTAFIYLLSFTQNKKLPMDESTPRVKKSSKQKEPLRKRLEVNMKESLHASADALLFVRMFARVYRPKAFI